MAGRAGHRQHYPPAVAPRHLGYMRQHYAAGNVVVAAAGALDHDHVWRCQEHFADLPGIMPPAISAGRYEGGEFREGRDLDQVHLVLGFPA